MMLSTPRFSTKGFTFVRETGSLVEEISTLSQGGKIQVWGQVYDDAADEGFTLVSHRTGVEVVYYLDHEEYSGQGEDREIAGWRFYPTEESKRQYPQCRNTSVLVIND